MIGHNRRFGLLIATTLALLTAGAFGAAPGRVAAGPDSPNAPAPWTSPANISGSSAHSNYPGVAGRADGSAGMVWTESDAVDDDPSEEFGANSLVANGSWTNYDELARGGKNGTGNSAATHDPQGRLHAAWYYQPTGAASYIMYGRNTGTGWTASPVDPARINGLKELAIAAGPDGRAHLLFGRHQQALYYTETDAGGGWQPRIDLHVDTARETLGLGVSSSGQVIALYVDAANAQHVMAKFLLPNGTWSAAQQVSSGGVVNRHFPSVAADANGGFHVAWDQGNPDWSDNGVMTTDIYYREWTPAGGWSPFIVQISNNQGDSSHPNVVIDGAGQTHILWSDWSDVPGEPHRGRGNFTMRESVGQGTSFSAGLWLLPEWGSSSFAKDPSADYNGGRVHLAFDSNNSGPSKDVYYMSRPAAAGPPTSTPTNTAIPTNTATPTKTPIPPTATNGPGCILSDVCPSNYWFAPVKELIRRGAISGYSDNTFRPFNNTTRSQLTKIVVVAQGWATGPNGGPHFSDVPANNPFYLFVETAYAHHIISGYSNGTFRPFDNVTRGQIAKVVVAARGWALVNPTRPTFSDVPRTNPFFAAIETAYAHGIISGYTDHTFRWQQSATRGQIAKVVYNAITAPAPTRTPTRTATRTRTRTPAADIKPAGVPTGVPTKAASR